MGDKRMKDLLQSSHTFAQSHPAANLKYVCSSACLASAGVSGEGHTRGCLALGAQRARLRSFCSSCGSRSGKCFTHGASMMMQSWSSTSRFGLRRNGMGMREKPIPARTRKNHPSVSPATLPGPAFHSLPGSICYSSSINYRQYRA